MELDQTQAWITISGYEKYLDCHLTTLTFGFAHHTISDLGKLNMTIFGKRSRCVIAICDNDMQYTRLYKKHSNMDGDIIMNKLLKDGPVKAA